MKVALSVTLTINLTWSASGRHFKLSDIEVPCLAPEITGETSCLNYVVNYPRAIYP